MNRKLTSILLTATLSALVGSVSLSAQDRSEVASIPFSFQAQGKIMPAGNYTVSEQGYSGSLYKLTSNTGQSIFWAAQHQKSANPTDPKLTFAHAGNEYVLASLSMPGSNVSHGVSESTIQKSFSRSLGISSELSVPLRAR